MLLNEIRPQQLWIHVAKNAYGDLISTSHTLNREVYLQSLFGLHVTSCAQLYSLAETPQPFPIPSHLGSRALSVSEDRQHLFETPRYFFVMLAKACSPT
jgi:hypothetical protein